MKLKDDEMKAFVLPPSPVRFYARKRTFRHYSVGASTIGRQQGEKGWVVRMVQDGFEFRGTARTSRQVLPHTRALLGCARAELQPNAQRLRVRAAPQVCSAQHCAMGASGTPRVRGQK